ncbi:MAG: hypothetical protein M3464_17320 [Chloroflexota bacterium]|nr:hypothetical protein [Chloroflexota bacterium]
MDGTRFDRLTKGLGAGASRRRVLAGLGAVTTGALMGRVVTAAPPAGAVCRRQCNAAAKATRRETCAELKSKEKNTCLKGVKEARAQCREDCRTNGEGAA